MYTILLFDIFFGEVKRQYLSLFFVNFSLSLSMEAQQKLIAEKETEVLKFKENLINYESLMVKYEAIQTKMDEQDEEFNR